MWEKGDEFLAKSGGSIKNLVEELSQVGEGCDGR